MGVIKFLTVRNLTGGAASGHCALAVPKSLAAGPTEFSNRLDAAPDGNGT